MNAIFSDPSLTIVTAVTDRIILYENLMASPCFKQDYRLEFIVKENYPSASLAYNEALISAQTDTLVFVHQDVYLPTKWLHQLIQAMKRLDHIDPYWGVLGCYGRITHYDKGIGWVYTTGLNWHGTPIYDPVMVDTLDEIVLVIRKSSGLRFDSFLPHFHLYATDICLSAKALGMNNYVVPAPCIHNTHELIELPPEYYVCYDYIKSKWKCYLPIQTPCSRISLLNEDIVLRRLREFSRGVLGTRPTRQTRVSQPANIFQIICEDL